MSAVRTRFAPSPTGYMHIGGMRTALFSWLWARKHGGQFILRIDDTDQQRNREEALQPILRAFKWLGLNWDEGPEIGGPYAPYFQSQRSDKYKAAAARLLAEGRAYKDFETPEQTKADREAAEKEKRQYVSSRQSLALSPAEIADLEAQGQPYVVRLLVPRGEKVSIRDHIRGDVEWDCNLMPDPVIQRGDGSALYNFASVVDDVDLKITHVIRSEEHLTNTAIQMLVLQALGATPPEFAHIPYVAAPATTKKLSKRDIGKYRTNPQFKKLFEMADAVLPKIGRQVSEALNPVMVEYYEVMGFLPEAVLNALSRLGWSLDDKTENMSLDFVIENFTLDRVVKGPAGLDPDKLLAYQEYWMSQRSLDDKVAMCLPYLEQAHQIAAPATPEQREFVGRLITALGPRLKLLSDILGYEEYFVADEALTYDEKGFQKRVRDDTHAVPLLRDLIPVLQASPDFTAAGLDREIHAWIETKGLQMGNLVHALRLALTGKTAGPGLFECLELLGRERSIARIERAITRV
ncbi:MAG: glutamate--tRNA ligase [Planctomycetota bacterium]|nr:MAG: glutamate--tRNA ligase [Planctomycetota bacterium]